MLKYIIDWIMSYWFAGALATGFLWAVVALFLYTPWENLSKLDYSWYNFARRFMSPIQQVVLNFVGGFSGWFCLFLFASRGEEVFVWDIWSLLLLLTAILGISGRLAAVLYAIQDAFKAYLGSKAGNK